VFLLIQVSYGWSCRFDGHGILYFPDLGQFEADWKNGLAIGVFIDCIFYLLISFITLGSVHFQRWLTVQGERMELLQWLR
jgi:hypothetical protein